ncbi:MAG TPA: hypothetical protein PKO44_03955 [Candidatus Omnitrophota bacterium]|nr:hypothetical protein [Candidatus Omnitrophota bacterium]
MLLKKLKRILNIRALTFTELLAASIITGIVIIGVASMDISLRNAFEGTSKGSIVAARVSALMHNISRHILEASGNPTSPGAVVAANPGRLWFRRDVAQTPSNYNDDSWHIYEYDPLQFIVRYCTAANSSTNCSSEIQRFKNITVFEATLQNNPATNLFSVRVKLAGRFNTGQPADDLTNPEYTLTSVFNLPSFSSTIP